MFLRFYAYKYNIFPVPHIYVEQMLCSGFLYLAKVVTTTING